MTKYRRQQLDNIYIAIVSAMLGARANEESDYESDCTVAKTTATVALKQHMTAGEFKEYRFADEFADQST